MELVRKDLELFEIRLSVDELLTLHQSLNEICNGFYLANFQERIGVSKKEALELMREISRIYHEIEKSVDK